MGRRIMKKLIATMMLASAIAGCSSQGNTHGKPEVFSDKGQLFGQKKDASLASNLTAFAGYPYLISDQDMPAGLRRSLDFTSGTYIGFSSFSSLWGATGFGALTMLSGDQIAPFTPTSKIIMIPLLDNEKYNDLSVAKRAVETTLEKIDGAFLAKDPSSAAYDSELKRLAFSKNKSMAGVECHEPNFAVKMIRHNDATCGIDGFNVEVYFSRPATGNEFPELNSLPVGNYAVMLINTYGDYELRKDASWAASFDSDKKSFRFNNYTLPFVSPDKTGKRILIQGDGDQTKILYK